MPKTKSSTKAKTPTKDSVKAETVPEVRTTITRKSQANTTAAILSKALFRDLTVGNVLGELVGTFVLVCILLTMSANPIVAGITVLFLTMAFMRISGGHVNPATTVALMATRKVSAAKGVGYIIAQLLGAMLALLVIAQFVHSAPMPAPTMNPYTGQPTQAEAPKVFAAPALEGNWRPFFAEGLGAFVLGMGVAAAHFGRRENLEAGYLIGGALLLSMLLASQVLQSALPAISVINPAAALGLEAYKFDNLWTIAVYALSPLIGAALGAGLFRVLQLGETKEQRA